MTVRVYLGGEGKNDLGSWSLEPPYRSPNTRGVIEALLRAVHPHGWSVVGATPWKSIRKLQAGKHGSAEVRNVKALALDAQESRAHVLAFVRDADDDQRRVSDIEAGIAQAAISAPEMAIVGEVAVPVLEAWLLAIDGVNSTEQLRKAQAKKALVARGVGESTEAMVQWIDRCGTAKIAKDATRLLGWLTCAERELGARVDGSPVPARTPK